MEDDSKVYRLYALALTDENIETASAERFHRITTGYVLIYTQAEQPENSVEITAKDAERLTDYDKAWLMDCVRAIMLDTISTEDNLEKTMDMLERIEQALAEEQRKNEE